MNNTVHSILAVLVAASPTFYAAKVSTFGCSSSAEVFALQRIRDDNQAFQKELYEQMFEGQCVEIAKGTVVEGSVDTTDSSLLLVDRRVLPPGYLAPLADFEPRPPDGKK